MKPAIQIQQEATLTPDQVQEALVQYLQRQGLDVVGTVRLCGINEDADLTGALVDARAQVVPRKRDRKPKAVQA